MKWFTTHDGVTVQSKSSKRFWLVEAADGGRVLQRTDDHVAVARKVNKLRREGHAQPLYVCDTLLDDDMLVPGDRGLERAK